MSVSCKTKKSQNSNPEKVQKEGTIGNAQHEVCKKEREEHGQEEEVEVLSISLLLGERRWTTAAKEKHRA